MQKEMLVGILGGLGLFLYGMNLMGTALQKVAGEKMKQLIGVLTNNRFLGVVVGAIVTMLIQSSSATTVMVVGFVNAGLMTLGQAIGVIMGANIGTTITAQLVAFKLTDIAPFVIAIGVFIWLGASKKKHKDIGEILIGFGILFLGMGMMSGAMKPLRTDETFKSLLANLENPFLGIAVGFIITAVVQSSSATTGMLLALASAGAIGNLNSVVPILCGQNIGTCVTAMISSFGANKTAKRAAFMHLLFNVFGTMIFMAAIYIFPITDWIHNLSPNDMSRQIANAHTSFNILNTLLLFPFANWFVRFAEKVIKGQDVDETGLKYIDTRIIETPSIAIMMASKEVLRMGKTVRKSLKISKEAFIELDEKKIEKVLKREKSINAREKDIVSYLGEVLNAELTNDQHAVVTTLFNAVNDLERIADHAENIVELAQYRIDNKIKFSQGAILELDVMFEKVDRAYTTALNSFKTGDEVMIKQVFEFEEQVDQLEKENRKNHIKRLNDKACKPESGIIYLETIGNLERIGDHSANIAESILEGVRSKAIHQSVN